MSWSPVADTRNKKQGLASRIVRTTIAVGIVTIATAGAVALISTFQLAAEKSAGRGIMGAQNVEDRIEASLREVQIALDRVTQEAATTTNTVAAQRGIEEILEESSSVLEEAYITETDGEVLASLPGGPQTSDVSGMQSFAIVRGGHTGFLTLHADSPDSVELWFGRTSITARGRPIVTLARINTEFMREVLNAVAAEANDRAVTLLEGQGVIGAAAKQPALDLTTAQWRPRNPNSGGVVLSTTGGRLMSGQYNDIQGMQGVTWRVVIVEPVQLAVQDTLRTVLPSVSVLVLGGLVGIVAAWALSQRMVRPLRELERAARSAAAGSYVGSLRVEGDDELSRVAQAFNAVALRLNSLHDLSQLLASASRLDLVLDRILSSVGHLIGPGSAAIYLLDDEGENLVPAQCRGFDLAEVLPVPVLKGEWLAEALYSDGSIEIEHDPAAISMALPGVTGTHQVAVAAPLIAGNEPLGVVVVLRDGDVQITDAEREMVRTFSAQAAVAVQNSRLFEEESRSRRNAEALKAVAEELVGTDGLEHSLRNVERIVRDVLGASFTSIVVVDRQVLGLPAEGGGTHDHELLAAGLRVLSRGAGDSTELTVGEDPVIDGVLHEFDSTRMLVVPISLDSEHGALLVAAFTGSVDDEQTRSMALALADEIALALDNAFFYERALKRAANLETIFRISQAVGSSLQVKVVLNRVLDVVQKILSADAVALLSYDTRKRTLTTAMARGLVPPEVLHLEARPGEDVAGRVFATGEPVAIRDLHVGMDGLAGAAAGSDLGSMIAVPLLTRGRSIGVLMVFSARRGAFSDEDLSVLQTFASQAALALDTARLYSREHEVASVLQQSILPTDLPVFDEIESDSVYQPAGSDNEIGGDYYDAIRDRDGAIWFAIADVCGKGVVAATKTSMIKYAARSFIAAGLTPGQVAAEVNRMTTETGDPSDIVTLWIGRYHPVAGTLTWANGGHPPGLLRRADGSVERLGTTGPLLGAVSDAPFEEETVDVSPGDRVLLYTDGVTEARQGNTFYGEERVAELFARTSDRIATTLLESVREYVEGELRDDIAVLALRIIGPGESGTDEEGPDR